MMTKKEFVALADRIRDWNGLKSPWHRDPFSDVQIEYLADFCVAMNPNFKRERWLGYIRGGNGPNGGTK